MGRVASLLSIKGKLHSPAANAEAHSPSSGFLKAFRSGFAGGIVITALLGGWMFIRWQDAAIDIQDSIPSKSAIIEEPPPENTGDKVLDGALLKAGESIAPLPPAPIEGLAEKTRDGLTLPITRISDDLTPFNAYRRPFERDKAKPAISFVVVDYGLSNAFAQSMLENLPADVSFALSPYATDPGKWASAARAYGHEFWLMLPMQAQGAAETDNGPLALLRNAQNAENLRRLFSVMSAVQGYTGLISGQDHIFAAGTANDKDVMEQIFGRGLGFVESSVGTPPYGFNIAAQYSAPYAQNNFWLDADLNPDAVERALHAAELFALRHGKAIVFLHPYPVIIKKLQEWVEQAPERGIQVAPLSALTEE